MNLCGSGKSDFYTNTDSEIILNLNRDKGWVGFATILFSRKYEISHFLGIVQIIC